MNPLAAILLLLVAAKGLGELLERAGYPSIIGEIGTGALHGPAVLNIVKAEATIEVIHRCGPHHTSLHERCAAESPDVRTFREGRVLDCLR
ncbi:MAG TPA: hypothetical protein PK069_03580 [Methanolinea sp.]|nr:hypothetical protein [Methanolinea sp.]HQK55526.1 hypothetical protein [Methanolinea sp.]